MNYIRFIAENVRWLMAGYLLALTSSYGQTYFISIFAGPIRAEFGLSHGEWGAIYSIGTAMSAVCMIWAGTITDRFRVRTLAPFIIVALAGACLAMASVSSAIMLGFVIFALRFTGQGMTSQISQVAMARWFQATRGRAISFASLGYATGQAILPIAATFLMIYVSWRWIWVYSAVLAIALIPILWWLLQSERTPQSMAKTNSSVGMNGVNWTRSEMLKHPLFWMCIPLLLGPPAWGTALFFQQVHLAETKGWELSSYVALYPLLTLVAVFTTFTIGIMVDKFNAGRILPFVPVGFIIGFVILSQSTTLLGAAIALCFVATSIGMQGTVIGSFWAEFYGTRHIGSIKSAATAVLVFGSAIGPLVSGYLIDFNIEFSSQLIGYSAYFVVSSTIAFVGTRRAFKHLPTTA